MNWAAAGPCLAQTQKVSVWPVHYLQSLPRRYKTHSASLTKLRHRSVCARFHLEHNNLGTTYFRKYQAQRCSERRPASPIDALWLMQKQLPVGTGIFLNCRQGWEVWNKPCDECLQIKRFCSHSTTSLRSNRHRPDHGPFKNEAYRIEWK